jgi:peroxiredoxin
LQIIMLHRRQLIPALALVDAHGRTVRAWDFKQSKNLVIAFLDAECAPCRQFVDELAKHAMEVGEKDAVVLLAFPEGPSSSHTSRLPPGFIAGIDVGGRGAQAFLAAESSPTQQLRLRGVFVTDRYGEVSSNWIFEGHQFPAISAVLSALDLVEIACEECSVPDWPVDE